MKQRTPKLDLSPYVKPGLSLEEVEEAKLYFDQMADKQLGLINAAEVREILQSYGQKAPENQLHYTFQAVLGTYGPDSMNCQINFEQFLYLVTSTVTQRDSRQEMRRLFNLYDDKREGFLTKEKLRKIAEEYGIWITDEQLELMIVSANEGKDGKVTEEEFYQIMTSQRS